MQNADPNTFKIIDDLYGFTRDKNNVYRRGRLVKAGTTDYTTCRMLDYCD